MNTKQATREHISALADGELPEPQLDTIFAALRGADAAQDWELYHRIGDALRSDEVADVAISAGFSARLAACLDAEPAIVASPARTPGSRRTAHDMKRWAVPGFAAAAAMAGVAFFTTPQLMVALNGETVPAMAEPVIAEVRTVAADGLAPAVVAGSGEVVLRDPRIDDYLLAHQRFSPSVYSSAQFARSATLPMEPSK